MFFQNLEFIFPSFEWFLLKKMLLDSHKVIFIEDGAVLLCLTMPERAGAFTATIYCIAF